jgi:SNF2 family DNA or RNA helicase
MANVAGVHRPSLTALVLDEAQTIKNAASKTAVAVKCLDSQRRLALSGTPIENRIDELLSIFSFLNPGLIAGSVERPESLVKGLRPLVLRRLKADALAELPEKTETVITLPMGAIQRETYESVRAYYREQL